MDLHNATFGSPLFLTSSREAQCIVCRRVDVVLCKYPESPKIGIRLSFKRWCNYEASYEALDSGMDGVEVVKG